MTPPSYSHVHSRSFQKIEWSWLIRPSRALEALSYDSLFTLTPGLNKHHRCNRSPAGISTKNRISRTGKEPNRFRFPDSDKGKNRRGIISVMVGWWVLEARFNPISCRPVHVWAANQGSGIWREIARAPHVVPGLFDLGWNTELAIIKQLFRSCPNVITGGVDHDSWS